MLELTGLSISLSFSQLGSDNTPAGEAIDYLFLLRARLVKKNRVLWYILKTLFCPSPAGSIKDFFFQLYFENLLKLLEINLKKLWWPLEDGVTLSLKVVHAKPWEISLLQFRFFLPWYLFSWFFSLTEAPFGKSDSLYSPVNLSNLEGIGVPFVLNTLKSLWKVYFFCSAF